MKKKELKIVPPEGYEIDKKNSTLECIKFKRKPNKWRDNPNAIISGHYIFDDIILPLSEVSYIPRNHSVFATKKQAKSALAMARISQIMANDERFGGPVTDEEWRDLETYKYVIYRSHNGIYCDFFSSSSYHFLAFHTKKQRDLFLEENKDLIKDYLMIN